MGEYEARLLVESFSKMINTHAYDTTLVLDLLKNGYGPQFIAKQKFAVIDLCKLVIKLRIADDDVLKSIAKVIHRRLSAKELEVDENFYFFALQFLSKMPN